MLRPRSSFLSLLLDPRVFYVPFEAFFSTAFDASF